MQFSLPDNSNSKRRENSLAVKPCFYIKPQHVATGDEKEVVVPYSISTSNHNAWLRIVNRYRLFLILFLHQTTTVWSCRRRLIKLFLILFLHQTTTISGKYRSMVELFLILFLHQTTTSHRYPPKINCCSLFYFYIKPQHNSSDIYCITGCSLFYFYIKPQLMRAHYCTDLRCSLFYFYIKPQPAYV